MSVPERLYALPPVKPGVRGLKIAGHGGALRLYVVRPDSRALPVRCENIKAYVRLRSQCNAVTCKGLCVRDVVAREQFSFEYTYVCVPYTF